MKYYLKVFFISFVCFALLIGGGAFAMSKFNLFGLGEKTETVENGDGSGEDSGDPSSELATKFKNGDRINILVLGTDGGRSDTMMVMSYDPKNKLADIISIPRDTYNHIEGRNAADQRKINAVYGFKGEEGGPEGLKHEISKILGVPITYYVELDYEAVGKVVDTIGGVEVEIPYKMFYDDRYDKPPLHIYFEPGLQKIDGENAMKYLRWRKNNDGSHSLGDLDRVKRQQEFVQLVTQKAMGFKLPFVIKDVFSYLKTDMNIGDMLYLGAQGLGFDFSNLKKHVIPGEPGMKYRASYYFHDADATLVLMKEIYERTPETDKLPGEGGSTEGTTNSTGTGASGTSN